MEQKLRLGRNGRKSIKCSVLYMKSMLKSFNALQLKTFKRHFLAIARKSRLKGHRQNCSLRSQIRLCPFSRNFHRSFSICQSLLGSLAIPFLDRTHKRWLGFSLAYFSVPLHLRPRNCPSFLTRKDFLVR